MSFFGFDTNLPKDKPSSTGNRGMFDQPDQFAGLQQARKLKAFKDEQEEEILDFDDTYDGLGDELDETGDDFNDDTFGGGAEGSGVQGGVGKDFDFFGKTARVANAIDEEGVRYGIQHVPRQMEPTAAKPRRTGYEQYNDPDYIPEIQAKSGFWSSKAQPQPQAQQLMPAAGQSENQVSDGRISTARPGATQPQRKAATLEEVEAAMRARAAPPAPFPQRDAFPYHPPGAMPQQQMPIRQPYPPPLSQPMPQEQPFPSVHQRAPSQSQGPLQILQNPNRPRQPAHSVGNLPMVPPPSQPHHVGNLPMVPSQGDTPIITHPQQLMQLSEAQRMAYLEEDAKRAKRNHKIFLLSKGNGLMTPSDKNFITRIQLQQLVTATGGSPEGDNEAAMAEDFYYQVYSQIRGAPRQHPTQPLGQFAQTYLFQTGGRQNNRRHAMNGDNHMQRMQQQVQRAVEAAKAKPKNKQLIIEGSLGKISFSNARTPKPLLNIQKQAASGQRPSSSGGKTAAAAAAATTGPMDRRSILRNIETVYSTLINIEDHERNMPEPPSQTEPSPEAIQAQAEWRERFSDLNKQLWSALKIMEPINPSSPTLHPFIAFLSFTKGKRAIRRIFRLIDSEQRITILTMIIVHLDSLDVIRLALPSRFPPGEHQPAASVRAEIDAFQQHVIPSILEYLSDAPINILSGLLQLVLDHTNVLNVAQTRVGLSILSMLLSSAELMKQTAPSSIDPADWEVWQSHFSRLFGMMLPHFQSLFLAPVSASTVDDQYVWQFLASVGIGASPEQQQRLVMSVKDRVMDTVKVARGLRDERMKEARLGNVNLFMKGLGLDVSMLG